MTNEELIEALIYLFKDCLERDASDVNDCLDRDWETKR